MSTLIKTEAGSSETFGNYFFSISCLILDVSNPHIRGRNISQRSLYEIPQGSDIIPFQARVLLRRNTAQYISHVLTIKAVSKKVMLNI